MDINLKDAKEALKKTFDGEDYAKNEGFRKAVELISSCLKDKDDLLKFINWTYGSFPDCIACSNLINEERGHYYPTDHGGMCSECFEKVEEDMEYEKDYN